MCFNGLMTTAPAPKPGAPFDPARYRTPSQQAIAVAASLGFTRNPATGDYHHKDGRQGPMTRGSNNRQFIAYPNHRVGRQRFFGGCMVPLVGQSTVGRVAAPSTTH